MERGSSHRLPQTPMCNFVTRAPRSTLDISLLLPTHHDLRLPAALVRRRRLEGSGPQQSAEGAARGAAWSSASRRWKGAAGLWCSNVSSSFQRPPWCVFKRKKKCVGFICKHFSLWPFYEQPWIDPFGTVVCVCVGEGKGLFFFFFFLVLFSIFFLSFAQQALGCRETWLGLDFLHWTLSYAAVPKHNFIWKCIDLKEENEFQLLWVLQTLCQTLEGSQLTDHKLQLRKGGLGLEIFFSYPLSRGFISVL